MTIIGRHHCRRRASLFVVVVGDATVRLDVVGHTQDTIPTLVDGLTDETDRTNRTASSQERMGTQR